MPTDSHSPATSFAWVGTYAPNGDGLYRFIVDSESGELRDKTLVSTLENPAQLAVARDGKTLYAASEVEQGRVQAWRIDAQGELSSLNQVASGGAGPVSLSLVPDGRYLLVANYMGGSIAVLPVNADGSLGEAVDIHQDTGPVGAARPQAAVEGSFAFSGHSSPHAHMALADPSGEFVYATDLGQDRIYQYRMDRASGLLTPNDPPFIAASSPGAGPRHFVFTPAGDGLWLINEESSTLTFYHRDERSGLLQEGQTVSSLPPAFRGTSFASGLVLSRDGKQLYVANRLHNSIAHFTVLNDGSLSRQDDVWTRGDYPRTLTLDSQGRWLYVMNQRSDSITRFRIDPQSGALTFVEDYTPVGSPSQMVFSARS